MIYSEDEALRSPVGSDRNFFYTVVFGKVRFANWFTGGYVQAQTSININDGEWHHTLGLWDGTTNTGGIKVFVDGVLRATGTATSTTRVNDTMSNNSSIIGGQNSTYDFDGEMANFQVWTTGLSYGSASSSGDVAGGEVATLYNYGTPYKGTQPQFDNLKVWYELDASATFDGTNFSIPDASSNSNTGTSSGMTSANLVQSDLIINAPYDSFSLDFDGTNDFITVTSVSLGTTCTFSCWVNFDSFSATTGIVFGDSAGKYAIYAPNSTTIQANFGPSFGAGGHAFTVPAMSTGSWYNIVLTKTGANGELFLNGQSQGTTTNFGSNSFTLNFLGCENQTGASLSLIHISEPTRPY